MANDRCEYRDLFPGHRKLMLSMSNNWECNWQIRHWQREQRTLSKRWMKFSFWRVRMSEHTVKSLPLQGRRILITRTHEQAGTFSSQLSVLGAIPVEFPTIRVVAPEDWEPLDNALKRLCEANWYDWLVFTSANGVRICFQRLLSLGYHVRSVGDVR